MASIEFIFLQELAERFTSVPCAIAAVERDGQRESREERFTVERARNEAALQIALKKLFGAAGFPEDIANHDLQWRHDGWGKPFVTWRGKALEWANAQGYSDQNLHVSNTHDGTAHLILAAYGENLVGAGVDVVHLPRLRSPNKGRDYTLRFARQFMSGQEWAEFLEYAEEDTDEELLLRAAAHFSLMESASKACGTGLKIGFGMGRDYSLPKDSIGVTTLYSRVELLFQSAARNRIDTMNVKRSEANWNTCDAGGEYLVSAVLLSRE